MNLTFNSSLANVDNQNVGNITGQFLEQKGFRRKYGSNFKSLDIVAEQVSQSNTTVDKFSYLFECSGVASFVSIIPQKTEVDALLRRSLRKKNMLSFFEKKIDKLSPQNNLTNLTIELKYYLSPATSENIYATNLTKQTNVSNSVYAYVAGALAAVILSITSVVAFLRWRDSRKPFEYHDATNNVSHGKLQLERLYPGEILVSGKESNRFMQDPSDGISSINNGSRHDDGSSINYGSKHDDNGESCVSDFTFDVKPDEFFLSTPASENEFAPEFKFDLMPNESFLSPRASENSSVPDFTFGARSHESLYISTLPKIRADTIEKDASSNVENESEVVDVCLDANKCFPSPERTSPAKGPLNSSACEDNSTWQFSLSSMLMRNSISSYTSSNNNYDGRDKVLNNITSFVNASNPSLNNNIGSVAKKVKRSLGILDDKNKIPHILVLQDDASSLSGATIDDRFFFASENLNGPKETGPGGFMYV